MSFKDEAMAIDKEFYDLCYDAWWSGRNPDAVDMDRYNYYRAQNYYPDEITLDMMLPREEEEPNGER